MSHPEVADGAGDQVRVEIDGLVERVDGERVLVPAPGAVRQKAVRQPTGDRAVDEVLGQLDQVSDKPLDAQIEVGERVHQVLQGRLADLGKV